MNLEEWRPCPGFEGRYEVSSLGRVKRLFGGRGTRPTDILRGSKHGRDSSVHRYKRYVLRGEDGRWAMRYAHHLVCEAFHGPAPFQGAMVLHRDDDPTNNAESNLRWGTNGENVQDAIQRRRALGDWLHWGNVKLTVADAAAIKLLAGERRRSQQEIGRMLGVSPSLVSAIACEKVWSWLQVAVAGEEP